LLSYKIDNDKQFTICSSPSLTDATAASKYWLRAGVYDGANEKWIYPFRVDASGKLFATGAEISGKFTINADSTLNDIDVSKINKTTITSTPEGIAMKAFEQNININGETTTIAGHFGL
jgi:hypothetical protein